MEILNLIGAILIGISLGLTGAGGSVITLPVLVYLAGIRPAEAIGMSLFVVSATAGVGAFQRVKAGEFHTPAGIIFASAGAVGAIGGSRLTSLVPEAVLMLLFAVLMILVAIIMLTGERGEVVGQVNCKPGHCLAAGTGVGVLTGFIGVGGGFLLMPALMHFAKLPLRIATGTSLAIVALNSFVGFLSHLGDAPPRWGLSFLFAGIAVVGVIAGGAFASRLPVARLRLIFALVVLATGILVLGQSAF